LSVVRLPVPPRNLAQILAQSDCPTIDLEEKHHFHYQTYTCRNASLRPPSKTKYASVVTACSPRGQLTLNHTLEFESDAQTTDPLSKRNPVTDFTMLSRLSIFNFGGWK
jgi:hypothetical protein